MVRTSSLYLFIISAHTRCLSQRDMIAFFPVRGGDHGSNGFMSLPRGVRTCSLESHKSCYQERRHVCGTVSSTHASILSSLTSSKILIKFSIKVWQKNSFVSLLFQQLTAARLQHLLKKPRDGLTPPRVIFYKTRFAAAFNSFSNARASFSLVCSTFLYRMAVPGKTTALGEAYGYKADYHQLCLFYFPNHYTVVL